MGKLVTIKTFTYPSEVYIIKGRLEADGVECFLKDENTVQANPMYSHAIGGVKLQVKEDDYELARNILEASGYSVDIDEPLLVSFKGLENLTNRIPFINRLRGELRAVIIVIITILTICLFVFFITRQSAEEKLMENGWCVEKVFYKGDFYFPNTVGEFGMTLLGGCYEEVHFMKNSIIVLPGFETPTVRAKWKLVGNHLRIKNADNFDSLYNRTFSMDFINDDLILKSEAVTIYCHKEKKLYGY